MQRASARPLARVLGVGVRVGVVAVPVGVGVVSVGVLVVLVSVARLRARGFIDAGGLDVVVRQLGLIGHGVSFLAAVGSRSLFPLRKPLHLLISAFARMRYHLIMRTALIAVAALVLAAGAAGSGPRGPR